MSNVKRFPLRQNSIPPQKQPTSINRKNRESSALDRAGLRPRLIRTFY